MNRFTDEQLEAALAECASEAIRIPGSIQPHGVLLTLNEPGLIIGQIRRNCASLLGTTAAARQVIGEARGGMLPGYLGQCFLASDIPPQARERYRLNWIRVIPDARHVPVPILPVLRPDTGEPLDLGYCVLRSVSPVHCQYLENMGVRASMSLSLLERDKLWGLITCAHPEPLLVSHSVRAMCAAIAQLLSVQVAALQTRDEQDQRERKSLLIN